MSKRINVILPEETLLLLDKVAPKGNRSRVISAAVTHYVTSKARTHLAKKLKEGALANRQRDLDIVEEWFSVDDEAWQSRPPVVARKA